MSMTRIKQIVFAFALLCLCAWASADTYSYDKLNRLTSVTYANGDSKTYSYDAAGNVANVVTVNVSNPPPVCNLAANPASITSGGSSTLTATCNGSPTAYVWTGGTCAGTTAVSCTVTPTATTPYTVAGTNLGGTGAPASASVTVTPLSFSLTVTPTGSGTVTSNPAGINCGATCSASFTSGSSVTLSAAPAPGSMFTSWGGACTGAASCVVSMSAARNVTAAFSVTPPSISLNPAALSFAEQHLGSVSAAQTVVLSNTGGSALTIASIAPTGDFAVTGCGGGSLAAGASCSLVISFAATATLGRVGSVRVTSNAANNPQSVVLSGTGVASNVPICTLTAVPSTIRRGGSSTLTASCDRPVTSYTWTGGTCAGKTTATCNVAPGATTTYSVTGTNVYGAGSASATVTLKAADLAPILMLLLD